MVAHAGTARKAEISTRSPRPTGTQRVLPSPVDPACRETAKLKYSHVQPLVALKYKIQPSQFLKTTVTARPLHQSGGRVKCTVARNKTHILPANRHQSNLTVTRDTKPHALKLPRVKRSNVECAHGAYALTRATRCGPRSLCYSSERFSEVSLSNPPLPPPNQTPHPHTHPSTHPTQPSPPPTPASCALPGLPTGPSPLALPHSPLPLSGVPRRWSASSRAADAAWGSAAWRKAGAGQTNPSSWPSRARAMSCTAPPPAGRGWGWVEDSG
jgi:hypothetical protein